MSNETDWGTWAQLTEMLGGAFTVVETEDAQIVIEHEVDGSVVTVNVALTQVDEALWVTVDSAVCPAGAIGMRQALEHNGRSAVGSLGFEDEMCVLRQSLALDTVTPQALYRLVVAIAEASATIAEQIQDVAANSLIFENYAA